MLARYDYENIADLHPQIQINLQNLHQSFLKTPVCVASSSMLIKNSAWKPIILMLLKELNLDGMLDENMQLI